MEKHIAEADSRVSAGRLITNCFCAVALTACVVSTGLAQGRGTASYASDVPVEVAARSLEVQRVIERSNGYFQSGEMNFKDGNFERARREYDRAIDLVLEAGMDIRKDARLHNHYQNLVEHIFRRQMTLMTIAPATTQVAVNQVQEGSGKPAAQQQPAPEKQNPDRGFGQQTFAASPLDELARLKLTDEETQGVTEAQAESAVAAARLDFTFKPNALIQGFINYYTGRGRATMEQGLRRSGRFMTMARKIFREEGVPQDLVWLGQVESAWSPIARSWAAAVGLWQFIPGTGARYGLRQDYYVDERSSFEKATRASARYLKWLANRYDGNWELAMAAYNSGEGRIDSAINRSGYADFWEIYSRGLIPAETRNYVPNILATIIIAKNPESYGFSVKPEPSLAYDTIKVNGMLDLRLAADATDTPYEVMLALNPELKRGVTPPAAEHPLRVPNGKGRALQTALTRIPVEKRSSWRMLTAQNEDTFETISRKTGISANAIEQVNGGSIRPGQKVIIPVSGNVRSVVFSSSRNDRQSSVRAGSAKLITYRVKRGDTLGNIAGRYSTSIRDIATLNRISTSSRLRAGQVLKIPVR